MNCIFRHFTSWWPTKDPPHDKFLVPHTLSRCGSNGSNMFKPNNQLWTPLISSGPNAATIWLPCLVRKPQGSWVIVIHIKRIVGWYGVTPKWPMSWGKWWSTVTFWGTPKKTSDSISEPPDLFQFVVPTKAATNKQHNGTRWWFSVLSWSPHQLYYIYDKPHGISYTNSTIKVNPPNLLVLWTSSLWTWQPCPACYPACMSLHTVTLTLVF